MKKGKQGALTDFFRAGIGTLGRCFEPCFWWGNLEKSRDIDRKNLVTRVKPPQSKVVVVVFFFSEKDQDDT